MDKINIKNLLTNTFLSEEKVPGVDVTKKAKEESGKENKKAIKDSNKKLSNYDKDSKKEDKDAITPVKFNYTDDSEEEYHQEMEIMNGQEMIQYDRTPSENFQDRAKEAIAGSSRMGNNPEWANVVAAGQGGDPTFGKKLVKAIEASAKKRSEETPTTKMFGDDWEITKDKSHKDYAFENQKNNKETIKESEKMKRLKFKKPFDGINNALRLIPESYRVNNKTFEMTDGNESYKIRWEGPLNEGKAVVLMASDKTIVNEDVQKMKHLMNFKSEDTLGTLKGSERINENSKFDMIWNKTKSILNESIEEELYGNQSVLDKNDDGQISATDFDMMRTDENDVDNVMGVMNSNQQLMAKLRTLNTAQEKIEFVDKLAASLSGGDDRLEAKMAAAIKTDEPMGQTATEPVAETPVYEDRFAEVFGGMDDDDEYLDDNSELDEGWKDFIKKGMDKIGGHSTGIEALLSLPLGKQIEDGFLNAPDSDAWFKANIATITRFINNNKDTAKSSSVQTGDVYQYLKTKKEQSNV